FTPFYIPLLNPLNILLISHYFFSCFFLDLLFLTLIYIKKVGNTVGKLNLVFPTSELRKPVTKGTFIL
ncbi:MAG: hypothetical protein U9Q84_00435, partial [Thermodesulfobacteriota bacterium]|nr:hypothetical protein [Thermodesulfobacteriota bacterium]